MAITDDIQTAVSGAFTSLGITATYTPAGGSASSITVIPNQGTEIEDLGTNGHAAPRHLFDVRVSELATPARGDTFVVAGVTYTVRSAHHPEDDSRKMIWRIKGEPA